MMCVLAVYMEIQQLTLTGTSLVSFFNTCIRSLLRDFHGKKTSRNLTMLHAGRISPGMLFLIDRFIGVSRHHQQQQTWTLITTFWGQIIQSNPIDGFVKPPTKDTELGLKYVNCKYSSILQYIC